VPIAGVFHSCGCGELPVSVSYSHKILIVKNLDNSGASAIESESLQLNKNAYGIRFYLIREKDIIARIKQTNSIFVQSMYAFTKAPCPEYFHFPSDSIVSIKIFTINDFDDQHLTDSDVTNYFRVAGSFSTIENYVAGVRYTFDWGYITDFEDFIAEIKLDLLLMTPPTATNNHQFKVQVTLSDGRILEQLTTEVQLL